MSQAFLKRPAFLVSAAILLCSAAALSAAVSGLKLQLRKLPIEVDRKVHTIPADTSRGGQASAWKQLGRDQLMEKAVVDELGTTNYLSRVYQRTQPMPDGKRPILELHLAYYTGMVDTVPHVPERCMVGAGWVMKSTAGVTPFPLDVSRWSIDPSASTPDRTIYKGRTITNQFTPHLPLGVEHATFKVSEFEKPGTENRLCSGYFFIANGGMCARAEDVRLLAFDLKSRYAFFLKVQVSGADVESAEKLAEYGADLVSDLLPDIMMCVPDWIDVERGDFPPEAAAAKAAALKSAGDKPGKPAHP